MSSGRITDQLTATENNETRTKRFISDAVAVFGSIGFDLDSRTVIHSMPFRGVSAGHCADNKSRALRTL